MRIFEQSDFEKIKREKILNFSSYETNFVEANYGFDVVKKSMDQPVHILEAIDPYRLMVPSQQRAWDSIDHLVNCYSAGHDISDIASLYPSVIEYWEIYARLSQRFKESKPSGSAKVAHIALLSEEFVFANTLISMGILLGWPDLLPRLLPIIDYNNRVRDGLLERLLRRYVADRGVPPQECARHLPYFKTIKIFDALAEERPGLLVDYLAEWYHASRREPYFDSHKRGSSFLGYWAWEAAAIAVVLDIDDTALHETEFYPHDLVAYARAISNQKNSVKYSDLQLRIKAGEACPKSGEWRSLDIPVEIASYREGELMRGSRSPYGITVWLFNGEN